MEEEDDDDDDEEENGSQSFDRQSRMIQAEEDVSSGKAEPLRHPKVICLEEEDGEVLFGGHRALRPLSPLCLEAEWAKGSEPPSGLRPCDSAGVSLLPWAALLGASGTAEGEVAGKRPRPDEVGSELSVPTRKRSRPMVPR